MPARPQNTSTESRAQALDRAHATLAALRAPRVFDRRRNLFGTRRWWLRRNYETLWPVTTAWSALCTLGSLPGQVDARRCLDGMVRCLPSYTGLSDGPTALGGAGFQCAVTPPLGPGGDRFYDDNAWLGLALVRHYELNGDPGLRRLAQRIFAFVVSGWSDRNDWEIPGGIRWKEPASNRSRNTCANGPASELAIRLYALTGEHSYLDWATRIYRWTRCALRRPDGLYADRMTPDGRRTETVWSYNQGTMIGAGLLLSRQSDDQTYLRDAIETASASLDRFDIPALLRQDPAFNAVFFRNLLMLEPERPGGRPRALAAEYGSVQWDQGRGRHGLFAGNGSALNNTAALLQIDALLAGAEPHP